jgi:hypothetical protein
MMSNRIIYRHAESIDLGSGDPQLATRDGRPRAEPDKLLAGRALLLMPLRISTRLRS